MWSVKKIKELDLFRLSEERAQVDDSWLIPTQDTEVP